MRTRVTARSAGMGAADGGAPDPIGGSVMSGLGVGGTTASAVGPGVWTGSAVTGFVYDKSPRPRKATPSAVRMAGTIRVRIRSAKEPMGSASYQRSPENAVARWYWYPPAMRGPLSIVAGLVLGVVVAGLLLAGIVELAPDDSLRATPTPVPALASPTPTSIPSAPASPVASATASAAASAAAGPNIKVAGLKTILPGVDVTP